MVKQHHFRNIFVFVIIVYRLYDARTHALNMKCRRASFDLITLVGRSEAEVGLTICMRKAAISLRRSWHRQQVSNHASYKPSPANSAVWSTHALPPLWHFVVFGGISCWADFFPFSCCTILHYFFGKTETYDVATGTRDLGSSWCSSSLVSRHRCYFYSSGSETFVSWAVLSWSRCVHCLR